MSKELIYINETPLKRFVLFAYDKFYPHGGLQDADYHFDDIEDALEAFKNEKRNNKELFDRIAGLEIDVTAYGLKG